MVKETPVVLTIAGSDSGGGAGIQADLKTFAALNVHGVSAITAITAQNGQGIRHVSSVPRVSFLAQLTAIDKGYPVHAIKVGMIYSAPNLQILSAFLRTKRCPIVIDPVLRSTSGARILQPVARAKLKALFPLATVVTPNLPEAEFFLERPITTLAEMRQAAIDLSLTFETAVLLKGGHLDGGKWSMDLLAQGRTVHTFRQMRIHRLKPHGTGCTLSSALATFLARGLSLEKAVQQASNFIQKNFRNGYRIRGVDYLRP